MAEQKETKEPKSAASTAPAFAHSTLPTLPPLPAVVSTEPHSRSPFFLWLCLVILACGLFWQWQEGKKQWAEIDRLLSEKLTALEEKQAQPPPVNLQYEEKFTALNRQLAQMEMQLTEQEAESSTLKVLERNLKKWREELTILEAEQSVLLAAQHLELMANIPLTISVLETADNRLAQYESLRYRPLRKAIFADLAMLRAYPVVDVQGISLQLESLIIGADAWALKSDAVPPEQKEASKNSENGTPAAEAQWKTLAQEVWREFRSLVRVQRLNANEEVLLPPDQVYFLRENIKLRLLNARQALLSRQGNLFDAELLRIKKDMPRYFDISSATTKAAYDLLSELTEKPLPMTIPHLQSVLATQALSGNKDIP